MTGEEVNIGKLLGQTGVGGVIAYALIRFGPLIETLVRRGGKNGNGKATPKNNGNGNGAKPSTTQVHAGSIVTWDELLSHCDRSREAAAQLVDARLGGIEKTVDGLRDDLKDGFKELNRKIEYRNGNGRG